MRRLFAILALAIAASIPAATAQTAPDASASTPAAPTAAAPQAAAQPKPDALALYRQGRDLESAGNQTQAQAKYAQSVSICNQELAADSSRIEAYVVKCWSLFRLNKHSEVIATGQAGMKVAFDARLSEVMGESYYYLGQMSDCLRSLQKYVEIAGDSSDRGPTAYFFMGEAYLKLGRYSHADMAYSLAVLREPTIARWWYRLGNAREAGGDFKRALDAYGKALSLSPSYQDAITAQVRVKAKVTP